MNAPGQATNRVLNFTFTLYNQFPRSYPAEARNDPRALGYTIKDRPVPEIPSIMIPGSNGGMSRLNYEREFGISLTNPAFLAMAAARIGGHEAIAHYLLGDPGHPYEEGITKAGIDYPEVKDLFISEAVKKKLLDICNTGKLP